MAHDEQAADQLAGGRGDDAPPRRRLPRAAVAAIVLLLVVAWQADLRLRAAADDRLSDAVGFADVTVQSSMDSLDALARYQAPLAARSDIPRALLVSLDRNLTRDAERWQPRLDAARQRVDEVQVLPWHDQLQRDQRAALARVDGWRDTLDEIIARRRSPSG